MNDMRRANINKYLVPKWLCDKLNLHIWVWPRYNRALLAGTCKRCGMNGVEFKNKKSDRNKQHKVR